LGRSGCCGYELVAGRLDFVSRFKRLGLLAEGEPCRQTVFLRVSTDLLGDLRDLSLCSRQPDQNLKTQRPPRGPAENAEKSKMPLP
jgi:hypothetical protein